MGFARKTSKNWSWVPQPVVGPCLLRERSQKTWYHEGKIFLLPFAHEDPHFTNQLLTVRSRLYFFLLRTLEKTLMCLFLRSQSIKLLGSFILSRLHNPWVEVWGEGRGSKFFSKVALISVQRVNPSIQKKPPRMSISGHWYKSKGRGQKWTKGSLQKASEEAGYKLELKRSWSMWFCCKSSLHSYYCIFF